MQGWVARQAQREKNHLDEYIMYLARIVGAAMTKIATLFSARSGKKVAHHCFIGNTQDHIQG